MTEHRRNNNLSTLLLRGEALSIQDVTLVPQLGQLRSRKDAILHPFIINAPMDTIGGDTFVEAMIAQKQYAAVSRFIDKEIYIELLKKYSLINEKIFFAIGLEDSLVNEMIKLDIRVPVILDIAHGDMIAAHEYVRYLKQQGFYDIMSGSICTVSAAEQAVDAGCNYLRVGVGPGSVCKTRLATGVGVPNLTAVHLIASRIRDPRIKIVADGGIKHPGDAMKYLAAGADIVMMGGAFAATKESPGWTYDNHEQLVKYYRGQASKEFEQDMFKRKPSCAEGISIFVKWQGQTVQSVVEEYTGGIASALSYLGMRNLLDLWYYQVNFMRITAAGYHEGTPHGLQ